MSFDAPVVMEPKMSSSAARPPVSVAILFIELVLRHEIVVAFVDLHGVAERAGGSRHDGYLLHGGGVCLLCRDERVAYLMVGDDVLFVICEYRVLLLIARDDDLDALLKVSLLRLSCARS